jgi:hypothetical protein
MAAVSSRLGPRPGSPELRLGGCTEQRPSKRLRNLSVGDVQGQRCDALLMRHVHWAARGPEQGRVGLLAISEIPRCQEHRVIYPDRDGQVVCVDQVRRPEQAQRVRNLRRPQDSSNTAPMDRRSGCPMDRRTRCQPVTSCDSFVAQSALVGGCSAPEARSTCTVMTGRPAAAGCEPPTRASRAAPAAWSAA